MSTLGPARPAVAALLLSAGIAAWIAGIGSWAAAGAPASATPDSGPCRPPESAQSVTASPVPGSSSDWVLRSFDGTMLRLHWFPQPGATVARPVPTILMGPGWGASGDTDNVASSSTLRTLTIKGLNDAGYNVLTWDPRGFGQSGGISEVDSPAAEGRDVEQMISWVATRPQALLDGPGDPRVGMVGASYGGGIQLATAAIDCRLDAIVPSWAWHSLVTSLYKADTVKLGWSSLLFAAATGDHLDPHIADAYESGLATGTLNAQDATWFAQRGPADLVSRIHAPTLLIQGTVDTLFTLDEAASNYRVLHRDGVPSAMLWFCGGHGVCLTNPGDQQRVDQETLAWLGRYLKRDHGAPSVPVFDFVDQNGTNYSSSTFPLPVGSRMIGVGSGILRLTSAGGSGPAHLAPNAANPLGGVVGPITPARAANALNVGVVARHPGVVAGAPELELSYRGNDPPGDRPTRVFAQIVDDRSGLVLDNQVTPVDVVLDGKEHSTEVPLETVTYTARPGAHLSLQLVATTVAYADPRLGGSIDFERVRVALPVAANLAAR